MSQPVDPDVNTAIVSRDPESPRTQIIRQAKQENFGTQNPDVKLGDIYDLINDSVKDVIRCYRFSLKEGNRPLTLKSSWKIREGILTLFWFLLDMDDLRGDGPAIHLKYIRGVVPFVRPDSATGTIKLCVRTLDKGLAYVDDFIQSVSSNLLIQVQKVSPTELELREKALEEERLEQQKKEAEQKAKERLAHDTLSEWKDLPPFEQSTFKSALAVLAPGLREEDLDRELSGPKVESKSSLQTTNSLSSKSSSSSTSPSDAEWDESLLSEKERAEWNAKGTLRFKEEKIHWQLMQFHNLVSQYFGPVRRVEDTEDKDEKTRFKLTDTIYCMNDVQHEFETRYATLNHVKAFVVQIWALPIFSSDEEASLRCKYEGNYVPVKEPSLFGFLAYLREGSNGRFLFERTFVSSAEKAYRSQQTISRTVDSFLAKLTELTQNLVQKVVADSVIPVPLSQAIKHPPALPRRSRSRGPIKSPRSATQKQVAFQNRPRVFG